MRKINALTFSLGATLLLILLFVIGRFGFIYFHHQSLEKIIGEEIPASIIFSENNIPIKTISDQAKIAEVITVLDEYTYTEYPHFFHPDENKLNANRLTVSISAASISVDANGFVFINNKLRDVEKSNGIALYRKLYSLFYPGAQ